MSEDVKSVLQKIISDQAASMRILATLESRLDLLREEFQRTSTIVYRLKLAQEGAKDVDRRRYEAIDAKLAAIEQSIAKL